MSAQPIRVTAAIVERDRRYLLARKTAGGLRGGLWEFPGGKVEEGETDGQALSRELREELGIEVSVGQRIDTVVHAYADVTIELRAYRCELTGGTPVATEHAEIAWIEARRLLELPLCDADRPIAERLARGG